MLVRPLESGETPRLEVLFCLEALKILVDGRWPLTERRNVIARLFQRWIHGEFMPQTDIPVKVSIHFEINNILLWLFKRHKGLVYAELSEVWEPGFCGKVIRDQMQRFWVD